MHLRQRKVQKEKDGTTCLRGSRSEIETICPSELSCQLRYRLQAERARPPLCENVAGLTINKSGISNANTAYGSKTWLKVKKLWVNIAQLAAICCCSFRSPAKWMRPSSSINKKKDVFTCWKRRVRNVSPFGDRKMISHIHQGESPLKAFGNGEDKTWKE